MWFLGCTRPCDGVCRCIVTTPGGHERPHHGLLGTGVCVRAVAWSWPRQGLPTAWCRGKAGSGARVASTVSGRPEHSGDGQRGMVLTMTVMVVRMITPAFSNAACRFGLAGQLLVRARDVSVQERKSSAFVSPRHGSARRHSGSRYSRRARDCGDSPLVAAKRGWRCRARCCRGEATR